MGLGKEMASDPGKSVLVAVARGDHAKLRQLLKAGAPVTARNAQRATALLLAVRQRDAAAVKLLVTAGADVNAQDNIKDSPFLLAGALGDVEILKLLIAAKPGPDFTRVNRYGGSALIPACERGHVDAVKLLIKAGVPVDHVNRLGWTGLLEAIILSDGGKVHQQIVQALIKAGADVDLADKDGVRPLQHAKQRGYAKIVAMLEAAGGR
jgi:ankyrin repeat protein